MAHKKDFLSNFLGNDARTRIVRLFVFNEFSGFSDEEIHTRTNLTRAKARKEIVALEKFGIIKKVRVKRDQNNAEQAEEIKKKLGKHAWVFNPDSKYVRPLVLFVREASPIRYDQIVDTLRRSGRLTALVLSGSFLGDSSRPADLLVAGDSINDKKLEAAIRALEPLYGRELRYASFSSPEFQYRLTIQDRLLRDTLDFPHLVLLDKRGVLEK